jgi:tetratricopeptide (TPR) repeat protein
MKKIIVLAIIICFTAVVFGGDKRFYTEKPGPDVFEKMTPSAQTEVALAEEVMAKRAAYRKELEKIQSFYEQAGNQLKLEWVQKELKWINAAPRYRYILQAEVAGDTLAAKVNIPKATTLYNEGMDLYNKAFLSPVLFGPPKSVIFGASKKKLMLALNKFNELIQDYPTSDKIDDAAYMCGKIHEYHKDYSIAVLYYKRCFQWNPDTSSAPRYKAARLLDYELRQRDEALKLYRDSLVKEVPTHESYREEIQARINTLSAEPQGVKLD